VSPEQIDKYSTATYLTRSCNVSVHTRVSYQQYTRKSRYGVMITVTCTFIHSRLCLILQQDQDHNYYIQISQAERPTFLRTRQLRPLLTPCEPLWPTMMMLSKLSRASSARPQQPLFRPRFTSQSFNRSIRTPRYRTKDTKLPKPQTENL
jgi:hypothetical protein